MPSHTECLDSPALSRSSLNPGSCLPLLQGKASPAPVSGSCTPPLAPRLGRIQPALLSCFPAPVSISTGWGCLRLSALGLLLSPWVMPARPLHLFPNSKIHCPLASPTQVSNKAAQTLLGQNGWNFPSNICPAPPTPGLTVPPTPPARCSGQNPRSCLDALVLSHNPVSSAPHMSQPVHPLHCP